MKLPKFKKILVLYKRSAYEVYFQNRPVSRKHSLRKELKRFQAAHIEHYKTLKEVERCLKEAGLVYEKHPRGRVIDYRAYDFVITVGGDGTFLEAARSLIKQPILGVNSDPVWSIGRFCNVTCENFSYSLRRILKGEFQIKSFPRLKIAGMAGLLNVNVLNDLLVAHRNPAAMSHYYLSVNGVQEEQRSSGLWISTGAGSTGAIKSAGGKLLPVETKLIQYVPRELHKRRGRSCRLTGGIIILKSPVKIISLMTEGFIFVDGAHFRLRFPFGAKVEISYSSQPLQVVDFKGKG